MSLLLQKLSYLFESKKLIAFFALIVFIPFILSISPIVYAASLNIPANCAVDVNSCGLTVPGNITNAGTIETSSGTITLSGNWINSGTFNSGTGTVVFNATSGTQTLNTGGLANAFYNLTHNAAGTVQLLTNVIDINNTFTNSSGTFDANNLNMNVGKNWANTATFTPGTNTVTFDGSNQQITGTTTFYSLIKQTASTDTLTLDAVGSQTITHLLTLKGAASNLLSLRSTVNGDQAPITLQAGGAQSIQYLDVRDSDASGGLTLVAGSTSTNSGNNTNWSFGAVSLTWDGSESTDWEDPFNWDLGLVPAPGDTVTISSVPANQPTLTANVNVANLTINANAAVTLAGRNLTVTSTFANNGNVNLRGTETVTLTMDTDSGTFTYVGNADGTQDTRTITVNGSSTVTFYNLIINDPNGTKDIFQTNGAVTANGTLTVTNGTLNTSTNSNAIVAGAVVVNGGTWTATNSTIDVNGDLTVSSGTLTAPSGTTNTTFTISGNYTHSGGTFTHSSGKVTLDGTNQTMSGATTFYQLRKVVAAAATLTVDDAAVFSVVNDLTLSGASGQLLSLVSDAPGTQYDLYLQAGGTQALNYLNVTDADACLSGTSSGAPPTCSGTGILLVAQNSTNSGNNDHWAFGGTTVTWDGSSSTDWNTQSNWDLGFVPTSADTVIITNVANQPILATDVTIAVLTTNASTNTTLNGQDLTVSGVLTHNGTITLQGTEAVSFGTMDTDSGTFTYVGNADGTQDTRTITVNGSSTVTFYNLIINDPNGTKDIFQTNGAVTANGTLTVTNGTLNTSTNSNAIVAGAVVVNGGTWTATNSTIDVNGDLTVSSGTLTAPSGTTNTTFTISGNYTHSGGTFTHSSGKVTLDGTNQTMSGATTFYQLRKVVAAAATLTVDDAAVFSVVNDLTLSGASGQLLSLVSDAPGTQYDLYLQAGGTQALNYLNVTDADACLSGTSSGAPPTCSGTGILLVARNSSVNGGNNDHWAFGAATLTWDGSSSTDWDTSANWDLGLVPQTGDSVIIPAAPANQPVLASAISVADLTLQAAGSSLTANSQNVAVTGTLSNTGTITFFGSQTISIATMDTDSGTITFVGDGDGVVDTFTLPDFGSNDYYNLTFNDVNATKDTFVTNANATINGALSITGSTLNISTNSNTLTVASAVTVNGTLTATNGNIDANSTVTIGATGVLTAPGSGKSFTIADDFSNSGTFTHSSGTVTFDTTTTATIAGNTTFHDFTVTTAGKTLNFTAGSTQTINDTLTLTGVVGNLINLRSTTPGTKWSLNIQGGSQTVGQVDVQDSDALNNTITCFNSTDSGNNNANWVFMTLYISVPQDGKTTGRTPTIIGVGPVSSNINIRDSLNNIVATVRTDSSGNFRVMVGQDNDTDAGTSVASGTQMALGAETLTPYFSATPGATTGITVVASPTTSQTPTIVTPTNGSRVHGDTPTIVGLGKASQSVTIVANDAAGNLLLSTVGSGTVDASGNYSIALSTALPPGTNYLSVTVDGVASTVFSYALTDPFGVVFDSSTNQLINNATVAIYKSDGTLAVPGTDLDASDTNPYTTSSDGFYSFLTAQGNYYMVVSAVGYDYPSEQTTFPSGRTIVTGSKGQAFTVGTTVIEMDHPVDGNGALLRIEKDANKSEARIGDIVTYTINIQNLSSDNTVTDILLDDRIPAGFKYVPNRALLDGVPIVEPTGNRPLIFSIGSISPGATKTLRYQLVIGSGVIAGTYENVAVARYSTGVIISNRATETVKVVLDPLFDLATVIGKVFYDLNENGVQDAPEYDPMEQTTIVEKPVPNVQIVMEDGTVITADREGKFNVPGLLPGRHILRLDERTLPPGAYLTTDKAVIIDVTPGIMTKVNFGVNMDNAQIVGEDAQFFNEKVLLTQDRNQPQPKLNVALFNPNVDSASKSNEILMYNGTLVSQLEWRIFTNYAPFISTWTLDIIDRDTNKRIKQFAGNRFTIFDPIFFNGRGDDDQIIRQDRKYAYVLTVEDEKGNRDKTKEIPLDIKVLQTETEYKAVIAKNTDPQEIISRRERYAQWLASQEKENIVDRQRIPILGETVRLNRQGQDIRTLRVLKEGQILADVPVNRARQVLPGDILREGIDVKASENEVELILPSGDYVLEVVGADASIPEDNVPELIPPTLPQPSINTNPTINTSTSAPIKRYSRKLKVGDDYMMFVALGDFKTGYTFNTGNIEPVQSDDKFQRGFWSEGKGAYYLKGKVKGKYLITSSFDTDRERKELYRQLDQDAYYPIYGDESSVNYDAANTQGPLYLLVEWDKSQAVWGNYAVDFNDTEFAQFSRNYYGGKIDYKSLANNPYGDARTKAAVFYAEVKQRPARNEMLGTGGSLYFLKHKDIVPGSAKISIEIRDQITGVVLSSRELKDGADFELDESEGRILFWQPVSMMAQSYSIISDQLLNGNPVYVVSDYQYFVKDKIAESSQGARVAQAVGDNIVVGATYVAETQDAADSQLKGADVTAYLGRDAKVQAEIAQTDSATTTAFVSTDGGITYTSLSGGDLDKGQAYGIKGDARLFERIGLSSYYKWIENSFASSQTANQQGKELAGLALTFDLTPVTRLTAKQDIQKLINTTNAQAQVQVGASETVTTMVQVVHDARRLRLTGEYQLRQVKEKLDGIESTTNEEGATLAGKAEYQLTDRIDVSLAQQVDLKDATKQVTTAGVNVQATDRLAVRAQQAFGDAGQATTVGATANVTDKLAVTTDYTIAQLNTGEQETTTSIGAQQQVADGLTATANVAKTDSSSGTSTTTSSVGAKAAIGQTSTLEGTLGVAQSSQGEQKSTASLGTSTQVDKDTAVKTALKVDGDATGQQTRSIALGATQNINDKGQVGANVQVDENAQGGKTTTMAFTDAMRINDQLQAVSERSFGITADGTTTDNKYILVKEKDGRKLEGTVSRQLSDKQTEASESNIFGLSGDVNDKLALLGNIERGRVQNLDGTQTDRTAFSLGAGYVLKDVETAVEKLKNSTKLEWRFDDGSLQNRQQFLVYNSLEGKVNDNTSLTAKFEYSKTFNTTTDQTEARHKEIILGAAYRPVAMDNLNLIGRYTYRENAGPSGQVDASGIDQSRMQVFSADAIYDINDQWQLAQKLAYRINDEKVAGFEFNRTHTWLMINRLNYKIDRDWTIGGEYRRLTQVEAKDSKQGFLMEIVRNINDNAQLGIGWNFSQFNDDLTSLNYTSQGPFLRMTGKFYDRTPEEKARAKAKWLDARINQWAWVLVRRELSKPESRVVRELNDIFALAQEAQKKKEYERARQLYKDIITAGQLMFSEAEQFIRGQISFEEQLQQYNKTAEEYFRGGDYLKARKLWEKVVEDAQMRVVQ